MDEEECREIEDREGVEPHSEDQVKQPIEEAAMSEQDDEERQISDAEQMPQLQEVHEQANEQINEYAYKEVHEQVHSEVIEDVNEVVSEEEYEESY